MFDSDQKPAGQRAGKACTVKVPVQHVGEYTCSWCGAVRDEKVDHYGMGQIVCPAGAGGFVETFKIPCLKHQRRGCEACREAARIGDEKRAARAARKATAQP